MASTTKANNRRNVHFTYATLTITLDPLPAKNTRARPLDGIPAAATAYS